MKKNNENKSRYSEEPRSKRKDNPAFAKKTDAGERPATRRKETQAKEDKPYKKPIGNRFEEKPPRRNRQETGSADSSPRAKKNPFYKPRPSGSESEFSDKKKYTPRPSTRGKSRFDATSAPKKRFKSALPEEKPSPNRFKSRPEDAAQKRKKFNQESEETGTKRNFRRNASEEQTHNRNRFKTEDKPAPFKSRRKPEQEDTENRRGRYSKPADSKPAKPFAKRADAEERPQRRTSREGSYMDKKKAGPERKMQAPEYNLKKYEAKKEIKSGTGNHTIRLNRYIANAGICSRRDADILIESGEIKVNGKVVTELGYQVNPNDTVKYGNRVLNKEKMVYVLLNKPKDFITTTEDPDERKTVMDLVKNACEQRIYPVGRLDRNTTGLLLLTNDGELAEKLAHPSNNIKKVYQVELDKAITNVDYQKIIDGVELEDGKVTIDELAIVTPDRTTLGLEIHLGRNRIVRRLFEHLGYEVIKLDRVIYAGLTKKDLPRGHWRFLNEKEVITLKYLI